MSDSTAEAARREAALAIVQRFEMYHSRVGNAIIPHEGDGNQYPLKAVLAMLEEMAGWEARNTQVTDKSEVEFSVAKGDDGSVGALITGPDTYIYVDFCADGRVHCYYRSGKTVKEEVITPIAAALEKREP